MAQCRICITSVLTCWCLLTTGCDPVRTTLQPVFLRVTNTISGEPVADAQVSLKYVYERPDPSAVAKYQPPDPELWHRETKEFWDQFPWCSGVTDEHGQADLAVKYTVLDRTIGPTPPSWRDEVTGRPYLIRLDKDRVHEEHSLVMRPGESARGKAFTVHVLEIRQPRYVKTPGV